MFDDEDERQALLIGVQHFAQPFGEELGALSHEWRDLPFAHDRVREIESVLSGHHYRSDVLLDPARSELAAAVDEAIARGAGPLIIHIISHGECDPVQSERLDAVTATGATGAGTNVAEWVSTAQKLGRSTLFLVDLCRAGRIAHPSWLLDTRNEQVRAWVIAASWSDEDAFDGRFSYSVATVLRQCAVDGLGTSPEFKYVSFAKLAQRIGDELARLGGLPQTIAATRFNPAQVVELPFFANPNWNGSGAGADQWALDESTDGLKHFASRAGRYFTGRADELRRLAPWCDGAVYDRPGIRVVTGSPGVGKSALLGALVGAAHPQLIDIAPHIRARLAREPDLCPSPNPFMAAVHLRQRDLAEVVRSIADQLGVRPTEDTVELLAAIADLPEPPVIVVDALDEALRPEDIQALLLLPLAAARNRNGALAGRLLVGLRPWWDRFDPLRRLAVSAGEYIDLDYVEHDIVEADLEQYLLAFLADSPSYSPARYRAVRERLAAGVARRLAPSIVAGSDNAPAWGGFLVATLYASYLTRLTPASRSVDADTLAMGVPLNLPDVFELDMQTQAQAPALRAALAAVAFAKGEGMPIEVVSAAAAALNPQSAAPVQVADMLSDTARFYLRTSIERDATTRYRLFHQGLADYLQRHPAAAPRGGYRP